jgi:PAS domain S-box-containing protein
MKILVVDENATNRKYLRVLLMQEGDTVLEGNDGIEALEILEREQIDAVISDILMPRMDGYRLCYEIRKKPKLNPILFIAYTAAYTSARDERLALDFGADKYLSKPALPEMIIKALHEAVKTAGDRAKQFRKPDELSAMKEYSEVLVRKLEETNSQLSQTSEQRLRNVIDGLGPQMFVGLMTPDGKLIEANQSALAAAGLKAEDVLGKPFEETYWWSYSEPIQRQLRDAIERAARGEPSRYDVEVRAAENQFIVIDFMLQPLSDETGKVTFLVPSGNVITDRKRAEEKVQQNLERIRALHEIATAISSTLDLRTVLNVLLEKIEIFLPIAAATTVRLLNDQTGELESLACRGLDENEWKSQRIKTLAGRAKRIVETKAPLAVPNIQIDARTYNAKIFAKHSLVSYLGVPLIAKKKVLGVLGLYTNQEHEFTADEVEFFTTLAGQTALAIHNARLYAETGRSKKDLETTNQHLERSLKKLDSLYTALTPLNPSTSIRETTEGILDRLIEATGAEAALIRLRDQQTGAYLFSGHRGFPAAYIAQLEKVPAGGALDWVIKHREPIISPDIASDPRFKGKIQVQSGFHSAAMLPFQIRDDVRGVVHIASRKLGYFDDQQRPHLMAIARQMSIALENKGLYENLRASNDELAKALKVKDEFLSVISHELKTPLIVLMEYANVLKDGVMGKINEDQEKSLARLLDAGAEQLKMINMILQTTQIESHALTSEDHFVEIADLLQKLERDYVAQAKDKGLELIWSCPAEPVAIFTDAAKLSQILRNLVDNAIKFTEEGCVTTSVRKREDIGTVEFRITDTGIGIAADMQSAIFEKLYQADNSDSRDYGGLGLGLYVVKKYCDLLGANIKVESAVGKGSTFIVAIPINGP